MAPQGDSVRTYRFGPFELDPRAGELRKFGVRIKLQEQPLQVLVMLLAQPGGVVLREEIQQDLWPNNTMVEFDHGINAALKRLRLALSDSADAPKYVETVARRGYRFIAAVETIGADPPAPVPAPVPAPADASPEWDSTELIGRTLNHYRVLGKLGSGGMGVVYRAEDTKLGRQVALKFLAAPAAETPPDILDRFRREAQVAAALNHPHICTIHSVEEVAGQPMIVMELVEGLSLADRLAKGPLPFDQTLRYGIQMARALEAGHRAGIVHRDLKPANIMLAKGGVKILDFGLAKWEPSLGPEDETLTHATEAGTVLGTLNYLSPEQAQGRDVDARSDIFAFGVVLYEMATGKKAFHGVNRVSVIAAILERQPPSLSASTPGTPVAFERLVNACLAKDPADRKQSLHDVAMELDWMSEAASVPTLAPVVRPQRRWLWVAAACAVLAAAGIAVFMLRGTDRAASRPVMVHVLLQPPEGAAFVGRMAVSPDGSKLAAVVLDASNLRRLWVRSLSSLDQQILPDTEGALQPFWSADSKSIGFFAREKLRTVSASGGPVRVVSDALRPAGGTWNAGGTILYSPDSVDVLQRVSPNGGEHQPVLRREKGEVWGHSWPQFLPDGRRFIFHSSIDPAKPEVLLGVLDSPQRRLLLSGVSNAVLAPPDHLLFLEAGTVMAQKMDFAGARSIGAPKPIAGTRTPEGTAITDFSASESGVLVYGTGTPPGWRRLTWRGRDGQKLGTAGEPTRYNAVFLAPDETKASVDIAADRPSNLWLLQLDNNVLSPLTFESFPALDGNWSPDSRHLVYQIYNPPKTTLMLLTLGEHSPKLLWDDGTFNFPDDWSPDGKWIVGRKLVGKKLSVIALAADGSSPPKVLLETQHLMDQFQFSPDGQWLAYNSVESGQWEVYVSRFPAMDGTQQLSNSGGCQPIWRKDGKELFYLTQDGKLMSVALTPGVSLQATAPKMLFQTRVAVNCSVSSYAAASNGQKFLIIEPASEKGPLETREPLHVLINWQAALGR